MPDWEGCDGCHQVLNCGEVVEIPGFPVCCLVTISFGFLFLLGCQYCTLPWSNPQLDLPPMCDYSSQGPAKGTTHPRGGPLTPLWQLVTAVTGRSPAPQVPQGSSSSLQSLAKLHGLAGWSGQLKSSCFLLLSSSPAQAPCQIQAAPSCAEGSFHRTWKYEKQRYGKLKIHQDPPGSP